MTMQPKEMTMSQPHDEDAIVLEDDTDGPEQVDEPGEDEEVPE
jgi:hypothetical protein